MSNASAPCKRYIASKGSILGGIQHTGETAISRAGPSAPYPGGASAAASGSAVRDPGGTGNVTLRTALTPADKSADSNQGGQTVAGSTMTLKEPIGAAVATLQKFNNAVDSAKIDYKPRTDNSNAYAGTAYQVLTGQAPPSSGTLPGSNVNLKPQIPACTRDPKVCGGQK